MSTEFDDDDNTEKRKETDAQRRKRLRSAVESVLATEDGRLVLSEIIGICQVEGINALNGEAAFRTEGARAVGLQIINLLRTRDPAGFMKLYREIYLP